MSEPVRINIPASVAAFVRPGVALEERLRGAGGINSLPPREQMLLLFCLSKDAEQLVRERAAATMAALPEELVLEVDGWEGVHPALLHAIALSHGGLEAVNMVLSGHPALAVVTRALLATKQSEWALSESTADSGQSDSGDHQPEEMPDLPMADDLDDQGLEDQEAESSEISEDDEEYLSKYKLAQVMGIGEKIKMALTGDKEWRKILIKDANKLVSSGVIKNPRITEPEVLNILKSGAQNDEIMRLICANREWVKNYQIRKALVENPKTPLANALRILGSLNEKDIAGYAKSRNISSVISTQAKRMLLNKKR